MLPPPVVETARGTGAPCLFVWSACCPLPKQVVGTGVIVDWFKHPLLARAIPGPLSKQIVKTGTLVALFRVPVARLCSPLIFIKASHQMGARFVRRFRGLQAHAFARRAPVLSPARH